MALNHWVGYYPTVQAAWGGADRRPAARSDRRRRPARPAQHHTHTGKLVEVNIPDTASGFKHRSEYVYLPPAWFAGTDPAAAAGGDDDRRRIQHPGRLDAQRQHHADDRRLRPAPTAASRRSSSSSTPAAASTTTPNASTARAATPPTTSPKTSAPMWSPSSARPPDPADWGVVGWSMGGTCAIDLTVMHPDLFTHLRGHRRRPRAHRGHQGADHRPALRRRRRAVGRVRPGHRDGQTRPVHRGVGLVRGHLESPPTAQIEYARRQLPPAPQPTYAAGLRRPRRLANDADETGRRAQDLCDVATAVDISCSVHTIATLPHLAVRRAMRSPMRCPGWPTRSTPRRPRRHNGDARRLPSIPVRPRPRSSPARCGCVRCRRRVQPVRRQHGRPAVEHRSRRSCGRARPARPSAFVMSAPTCQNVTIGYQRINAVRSRPGAFHQPVRPGEQQVRRPPDDRVGRVLQEQHPGALPRRLRRSRRCPGVGALREPHGATVVVARFAPRVCRGRAAPRAPATVGWRWADRPTAPRRTPSATMSGSQPNAP